MTSAEQSLIQRHFAPLATHPGALGLRDDAAIFAPPPGHDLVLTADAVAAGVHFFPDDAPGDIAMKALRVNLSDLAAKGAAPLGCLLTLSLPAETPEKWIAAFARGLGMDLATYDCPLLGGDTVRAPILSASITALGAVPAGAMVRRDGARAGDLLFVSGTVGDAALGLQCRSGTRAPDDHLLDRYLCPRPRLALAEPLRAHASAAMDVSDGLVGDCDALLAASNVGGTIERAEVPLSPSARRAIEDDPAAWSAVLTGGDDYEILAAIPPDKAEAFARDAVGRGIAVSRIGRAVADTGPTRVREPDGGDTRLNGRAYSHL